MTLTDCGKSQFQSRYLDTLNNCFSLRDLARLKWSPVCFCFGGITNKTQRWLVHHANIFSQHTSTLWGTEDSDTATHLKLKKNLVRSCYPGSFRPYPLIRPFTVLKHWNRQNPSRSYQLLETSERFSSLFFVWLSKAILDWFCEKGLKRGNSWKI